MTLIRLKSTNAKPRIYKAEIVANTAANTLADDSFEEILELFLGTAIN